VEGGRDEGRTRSIGERPTLPHVTTPTAVVAGTWYEVDLTSIVTGNGTYTVRISSTSTNGADFASKEGLAGFAPQLVVTLTS
jgi:hypothetical protein